MNDASGNVGIGNPAANVNDQVGGIRPLLVSGSDAATTISGSLASIVIGNANTTTSNTSQLGFAALTGANSTYFTSAAINCVFGARTNGQYPTGQLVFSTSTSLNSAPTEKMRIDSSGNLLVGMTTGLSTERFSVAGSGAYVGVFQQSTNTSGYHVLRCGLQQNGNNTSSYFLWGNTNNVGNWYLYGNGTTSFTSDSRLKKNIETTRDGYLDDIAKLRVVKYNWRNDEEGKPRELGLIAQEVEQVFPGLVQDDIEKISPDDDTVYKTVKQSVLPFILLKAIQELKAQNDELKARVEALEAK